MTAKFQGEVKAEQIRALSHLAAQEDVRYYLNGMLFESEGHGLRTVAADGHRLATCRREVFRWLVRYNTRRRHSWCGYLSPSTYEARRAATLPTAA